VRRQIPLAFLAFLLSWSLLAGCSGCNKEEISDFIAEKQEQFTPEPEPKPQPVDHGSIELDFAEPVKTDTCHAQFHSFHGRPASVLQLTSYADVGEEKFPAVLIRAVVAADSPAALVDQAFPAEIYVTTEEGDSVWHTATDAPVEIRISSFDNGVIAGEVAAGSLVAAGGESSDVTGRFHGQVN
jgi:hypothetical protein